MPEGGKRQTVSTGKIKENINLKDTSGVLCTDLSEGGSDLPDQVLSEVFVLHHLPTAFIQALCLGEVLTQQSFWDP